MEWGAWGAAREALAKPSALRIILWFLTFYAARAFPGEEAGIWTCGSCDISWRCHFGQASERLHEPQSTISQEIRALEDELGAAL